ncbi:hypothetical protein FHR32_003531 [Streptosporangium album]|uniref:DUF998 domain-containing protein n=1 Tax=Streptosporangium album TaxID=47479 RepID=A0A7W7W9S6_9ACTN|nr:DUF998 domain-containing protein [Streptosporangium album]MBB4939226.1 hypothetical protein [Streptosporangium album]
MTQQTTQTAAPVTCDPRTSVTRSLLGYGVVAGPVYVVVSLAQALTRDGFDLARHQWSMLANGDLGWIQIANLILAGLTTIACAAGLRRALTPGRSAIWISRLVGAYGVSMIGAGIFRADPAMGFPAGTPEGPGAISWHGMLHFACGAVGFLCVIAACFLIGRRFSAEGRTGWAFSSRLTGVLFLAAFAAVATGAGAVWANLSFVAGILIIWTWLSALSLHLYRRTAPQHA